MWRGGIFSQKFRPNLITNSLEIRGLITHHLQSHKTPDFLIKTPLFIKFYGFFGELTWSQNLIKQRCDQGFVKHRYLIPPPYST